MLAAQGLCGLGPLGLRFPVEHKRGHLQWACCPLPTHTPGRREGVALPHMSQPNPYTGAQSLVSGCLMTLK